MQLVGPPALGGAPPPQHFRDFDEAARAELGQALIVRAALAVHKQLRARPG